MSYLVLARKWRPLTFDQMVGQRFISRTLRNAVASGRVAHAFLFTGSRGVGKTSAARILAKCLNCDRGPTPEPCNQCTSCVEINEGRSLDVYEIDGASNTSVDDVRELRENIRYMPKAGKRRIYIIDEVHMLSRSAFNALLKTLEEPPEHVLFIFATTEPHKVPDTIQSRCQRFDFRRIPAAQLHERLREIAGKESLQVSDTALSCIVKAADGSMRDAQSLMDQVISYCGSSIPDDAVLDILGMAGRELFLRISGAVFAQDPASCLEALDELYRKGYDLGQFYRDLTEHFRDLLVARTVSDPSRVLDLSEGEVQALKDRAEGVGLDDLQRLLTVLLRAEGEILRSGFPRVSLEVTLIRMASLARLEPLERILERIDALQEGGALASVASGAGGAVGTGGGAGAPPRGPGRGAGPGRGTSPAAPGPRAAPEPPPPERAAASGPAEPDRMPPVPAAGGRPPWSAADAARRFVEAVRKERSGLGALLEDVHHWEILEGRVRAHCEEGSFVYQRLRNPEVQERLARVAGALFSGSPLFQVVPVRERKAALDAPAPGAGPAGPEEPAEAPAVPAQAPGLQNDPAVQETLELFRGEITEVKPPEGGSGGQ